MAIKTAKWPSKRGQCSARVLRRRLPGMKSGLQNKGEIIAQDQSYGSIRGTLFRVGMQIHNLKCSYYCFAMPRWSMLPARSFLDTLPRGERRSLARAHCSLHLEREKISNEINPWGERARNGLPAAIHPPKLPPFSRHFGQSFPAAMLFLPSILLLPFSLLDHLN